MACTVSEAISLQQMCAIIRKALENSLAPSYMVAAEVQQISCNRSGHAYLELIEKSPGGQQIVAQARATIWASQFRIIKPYFETVTGCPMKPGIKILVKCKPSFHEVYGLSLNITDIMPEYTVGEMALERQRVIAQLRQDGVFDMNRQLEMPRLIKRIAVISSATAAGYGDFANQLKGNSSGYTFATTLFEAAMQGRQAEPSIIAQLENIAASQSQFDCVAIIRGGGSRSDLQCFDGYGICQNICQFPLPVITGIGHERDESVADLVACLRLKTPTAVAQFLIDRSMECEKEINAKIASIGARLRAACPEKAKALALAQKSAFAALRLAIQKKEAQATLAATRIHSAMGSLLAVCGRNIETAARIIEATSPQQILKKGYTYTMCGGKALKSAAQAQKGSAITTVFHDGQVQSTVS